MTLNVSWVYSPNFGAMERGTPGRAGQRVIALVNHHTGDESPSATIGWFKYPASEVSSHYLVDKAGTITQFVHANDTAWHSGLLDNPDLSIGWLSWAISRKINPNLLTIGIEHTGIATDIPTPAQYEASVKLQKYLIGAYRIAVDSTHIIAHSRVNAGHNCPGPAWPWRNLLADLQN